MLYSLPYNDTNPDLQAKFYKNIFSVTRQVHYSDRNPNLSIDMVVFLNGLTIATLELKNPWSGQTVYHAKKQYREDRDPKEPLLQFARCIVHFAVDTDEVYMTTRLAGKKPSFCRLTKASISGRAIHPILAGISLPICGTKY